MDDIRPFILSLDTAIQDIQGLESVMLEETRALESRDADQLAKVVAQKQDLVTRLEAQTARQRAWVESSQQAFTSEGVARFMQDFDQGDQLAKRWAILRDGIARCDRLNQGNARLIERDRQRVANLLRILRGEDSSATTYDPKGRTEAGGQRGRTITQA